MVKNGRKRGSQTYKCHTCGRTFVGGRRIDDGRLLSDYIEGKQTLSRLAERYGVCVKTVWSHLKSMRHVRVVSKHKDVVVNMDTTYWGRGFGLMVIKDSFRNRIIWYKFVRHETIAGYMEGIGWLEANGFIIHGVVCDGLRGLFRELWRYKVQMCQFHQMMIVRRYLTQNPDAMASRELLRISRELVHTDKESFQGMLRQWHATWKAALNERTVNARTGRSAYTRPRLRSAYLSLKRNMPWLWTFYDYPELHIPNTNNALEGVFTNIKTKLRVHSGISKGRRIALIQEYIARHY